MTDQREASASAREQEIRARYASSPGGDAVVLLSLLDREREQIRGYQRALDNLSAQAKILEQQKAELLGALEKVLTLFPGHDEAIRLAEKFGLELGTKAIIEQARTAIANAKEKA